jgi:glycosyltransferase involved in cell wall biosynthesis
MRVLIVTTEYRAGSTGGVESVVDFLLSALRRRTDWEVEVASLRMSRRAYESRRVFAPKSWWGAQRVTTRQVDGIDIHQVGSAFAELELSRFLPRKWMDSLVARADVVVVIAGTPAACNAVRGSRVPVVLQVATLVKFERAEKNAQLRGPLALYRRITTWLTSKLDDSGLRIPDVVLVENTLMLEECAGQAAGDVVLCPPGVDTDLYRPDRESAESQPYILMVARLDDARKNVAGLIRAYARARDVHGVTHDLVLAGKSSPCESDLRLIGDLQLAASVRIHSPVSPTDLVKLYQGADLFASASFEEGLGLTFLEAMSCAIPVVTTDTAGATYILSGSLAGAIVPLGQELTERFASEIARWCGDERLRSAGGVAARERVMTTFAEKITAQRFISAIGQVSK